MIKDARTIDALLDEVRPLAGQDSRFDAMVQHAERLIRESIDQEFLARPMTEAVARVLQAAELLRHSTREMVDVFMSTRNSGVSSAWGSHYGTLSLTVTQAAAQKIIRRATVMIG